MDTFESQLASVSEVVRRYVRYKLRDRVDAEDVFQEVCTLAYLKYGQLKDLAAFKGWILAIARTRCTEYYRKQAKIQEIPLDEVPEVTLQRVDQENTAVEDTLALLNPHDRELLQLTYWEEMPQSRIAQRLGIPVGTVKSRLHKAKERFREQYPYPPRDVKGEEKMGKFPKIMPQYTIEKLEGEPFSCRCEELQGWLLVPRLGEKLRWAMYDFPEKTCTSWTDMSVVGRAEVHGIQGVEITAIQYGAGDDRDPGFVDSMERRFVAQLTDTHTRYLAESHLENGIRKCYTFLDGEAFLDNWGYGPDNIGSEIDLHRKGLIHREGSAITAEINGEVMDVVGRYAVTINGKCYDTICLVTVQLYDESVMSEQFIDEKGRTILWRRFNRDDWAMDRFGGKSWSEKFPDNERLTVNGETFVHWYDCISDYVL